MTWILIAGLAWTALAFGLAVFLGRGIRLADEIADLAVFNRELDRFFFALATGAPADKAPRLARTVTMRRPTTPRCAPTEARRDQ